MPAEGGQSRRGAFSKDITGNPGRDVIAAGIFGSEDMKRSGCFRKCYGNRRAFKAAPIRPLPAAATKALVFPILRARALRIDGVDSA